MKGTRPKAQNKPQKVTVGSVTVKIYTRIRRTWDGGKRTIYEVADYTSGKRDLRGFSDSAAAQREAKRIATQISAGKVTAANMTNAEAAAYGAAMESARPTGLRLETIASNYAKIVEILEGDHAIEAARFYKLHRADKIEHRKVADVVAELIAAREARNKSDRYIADIRARLNRFAKSFAVDISTITGPDIQTWIDRLKVAPRTAKNFRSALNTLSAFAESRGYILKGSNPVADTEEINGSNDAAIEIYTPQEIEKLLEAAPSDFKPFLAVGAFAGLRAAEIERLLWSDVDLTGRFITVEARKAKTRSRRIVPIAPNLNRWLARFAKQTGNVWKGTPVNLLKVRRETTEKAGVEWKDNALRHSFISYRLAEIQDVAKVSLEAGNSPQMVFRHYRELVKPSDAAAWFGVKPEAPDNVFPMAGISQFKP